jgi:outer membrane protein assembly factor BamB/tetratricopeptide (TPR) repeat protein
MNQYCRASTAAWILGVALPLLHAAPAGAQFSLGPFELSSSVTLDEADSSVRMHLERIKAYVADHQWDEAVEALRRVMESDGAKMIAITPRRYVNLTDFCHVQIAALPDEALALYRQRVDSVAQNWYDEGLAQRDANRLAEVVDKMFCSSWGDDALLALGEIELERGNYSAARRYWEQLIEIPPGRIPAEVFEAARKQADLPAEVAALLDKWYALDEGAEKPYYRMHGSGILPDEASAALVRFWKGRRVPVARLAYPGTTLPLADIRARLILVSIMERSFARAGDELAAFRELHPDATGRMAGRTVNYAETLTAMATAAQSWPQVEPTDDWPTFGGNYARSKTNARTLDLGPLAWEPISLGEALAADSANSQAYSLRRIGEDAQRLMSYHPLVVGNLLLVNNRSQIFAFDLKSGAPAWPGDPQRPKGEIYADATARLGTRHGHRGLGVPRFTMTAHDNKLFARMGSQITSHSLETYENRSGGYLVCLDLSAQGRLVWKPDGRILPDDDKWAFEGAPVVDGSDLYVAMRKSDVRPQAYVACFDVETGRRRWRTMICSAETPGGGQLAEITHNLLTFDQGTLYYNTNLGLVAALSARDGRLQWATLYPRAKKSGPDGRDKRTAHFYRDLNPCIYYRGKLLVAPADCESIFALEAGSGELIWETALPEDVVHLLGVGAGNLLASGDTLWWIDVERGKVLKRWPDTTPLGHGRGILMGDEVVWPTDGELYLFDQQVSPRGSKPRPPLNLSERQAAGGNLVAGGGLLLIATPDKLFAFRQQGQQPASAAPSVARRTPSVSTAAAAGKTGSKEAK